MEELKEFEISDDGKTLDELVKEVAKEEGISEDEVYRHLQAFSKAMQKNKISSKTNKVKAKSKRKMAKKSKKKNR